MVTERYSHHFSHSVLRTLLSALLLAAVVVGVLVVQPAQAQATDELSAEEVAGLLFMREEEKLAHDVYVTLGETWDLPIFANIARSEQQHTDAVRTLLVRYDLDDPAAGNAIGLFVDPTLQALYTELVTQGSTSLADALYVGATIEDLDIVDLQSRLAACNHADIQRVYEHLLQGSSNHLRAFTALLEQQTGEAYVPQVLDQESYDAIIEGNIEGNTGHGRRGRGRS
ncbi:MAG: DUF2202 domain-containing protein [Caldilineaceae bacterium]|nr:DUF2202 domain-containing protein [Caldilineaceae bacterium]